MTTLTLVQFNPSVGDLDDNVRKIYDCWKASTDELVIFPECATSGYPAEDLVLKPFFLDEIERHIQKLCEDTKNFLNWAIIGTPWRENGRIYNAALLIGEGKIQGTSYKHILPNYGVFDDKRFFSSGPLPQPLDFKGKKLGIMVCEDMWFPEPAAHLKQNGAAILITINASPFEVEKHARRVAQAKMRVQENALPLIYVNQLGGQDDLVFDGGSFIMDERSEILSQMPFFDDPALKTDHELAYAAIKLGLKDYVHKNGFPGVLIGMSGGIDSALSAAIAVDALDAENVRCVMMPSPFTSQDSLDDAEECAKALGCSYDIIPIEQAMQGFENTIPDLSGVAHENMQSRIRGLILMALSNQCGYMVLSTGNKSEMAVGYATLYGDMCGGYNALKDIYKTLVYDLARWRNAQSPVIPARIITKAPSAELKDNQTDQDTLPPYDVLDDILHGLIEEDLGPDAIALRGHDKALVEKVMTMLDRTEYKRRQAPPGPKITAKALSDKDRRYPMTNGFVSNIEKA